jgi:hypothetical protein
LSTASSLRSSSSKFVDAFDRDGSALVEVITARHELIDLAKTNVTRRLCA